MVPLFIVKKIVLLVTICFVNKNVLEIKHQVIHFCKGQASFFLRISVSVMVLSSETRIYKGYLYYTYLYNPPLTALLCVNPSHLQFVP